MSASPEYGGKCRAARGDRSELAYTGQNRCFFGFAHTIFILSFLLTLAPFVSSADTFPDKRGQLFCMSHFDIFWFYPHYFLFFRFCSHLPLSSANADTFPVVGDGFFVWAISIFSDFTHTIFILSFLLILTPFVNLSVDTLAKGKASHSLL